MSNCEQELCPNWSGDGNVCPCALFELPECDCATEDSLWFPCTEHRPGRQP